MLQLLVQNQALDLFPDTEITIEEESPVYGTDSILGGFAYPFSVPVSPRNSRILGFPERPGIVNPQEGEYPFQLFHSGILRMMGTLQVSQAGKQYECFLRIGSGDFAGKVGDKKLSDLTLGGARNWVWKPEYSYPEDDFTIFPIYNPNFMLETVKETSFQSDKFRINAYENGAFVTDPAICQAITPFPFLCFVIKQVFAEHGFQLIENCFETDSDLRDLVIYSIKDITTLIPTTQLIQVNLGTDQYGQEIWEYMEVATTSRGLGEFHLKDCVPDISIKDLILWLRSRFNVAFVIDRSNQVKIIKREKPVMGLYHKDITDIAYGEPTVKIPDRTNGFALCWEHDSNDELFSEDVFRHIDDFLSYLKEPVANSSVLAGITPELNEIRLVESLGYYYRYAKKELEEGGYQYQWQLWSIGYQNYLVGERMEEFFSGLSTLQMINYQRFIDGPSIRCPWAKQKGNFMERDEPESFSPRLLFYRGMQIDTQGKTYPMGTMDNRDRYGNFLAGKTLSLLWEGEYGIYSQLWKRYLIWWKSRKEVDYLIKDPSILDFTKKYRIDGTDLVLKKRTIQFSEDSITPSVCEFINA